MALAIGEGVCGTVEGCCSASRRPTAWSIEHLEGKPG